MIRRERRKSNFSQIPNETLRDANLSNSAYRLLMYMLSMSDEWVFRNSKIAKDLGRKEGWVKAQLHELELAGYIDRKPLRDKQGRFKEWERIVHEKPVYEKPHPGEC